MQEFWLGSGDVILTAVVCVCFPFPFYFFGFITLCLIILEDLLEGGRSYL